MEPRLVLRTVAALRLAFGAALTLRTEPMVRMMVRNEPHTGSLMLFARTLGIRDLFLGLGALTASGDAELKRWSSICLASDVADLAAGATASRHVGRSGAVAAAGAPIPFIAAGAWAIRRLMQSARATEA